MVVAKPERIPKSGYPDQALLDRLSDTRLEDAHIPEHEFLQFRRLQSLIYGLRLAGYDIEAMQTEVFVGAALYTFLKCTVAVTRCEYDFEVNETVVRELATRLPVNLTWLTTNANLDHPTVKALPIGLTDYCGYSPYHAVIGDTQKFKTLIDSSPRTQENLVVMNFNDQTNAAVRAPVRTLFNAKPFVTSTTYTADDAGYARYIRQLRSHAFCLAPRGNGIDTHRIWESLYAGCIPIVQKSPALKSFEDLPIYFVKYWEQAADEKALTAIRDEFHARTWDLRKLTLSYWYQTVLDLVGA